MCDLRIGHITMLIHLEEHTEISDERGGTPHLSAWVVKTEICVKEQTDNTGVWVSSSKQHEPDKLPHSRGPYKENLQRKPLTQVLHVHNRSP